MEIQNITKGGALSTAKKIRTRTKVANPHYQRIQELGYEIEIIGGKSGKSFMFLTKNHKRIYKVEFMNNKASNSAIKALLPTCQLHKHKSNAMEKLLEIVQSGNFTPLANPEENQFITFYNRVLEEFGNVSFARVQEKAFLNPELTNEQLFRIWSVEMSFHMKNV